MAKQQWHTSEPKLWRKLAPQAKGMRREPTVAEQRLWQELRRKTLDVRFRRQHPIDRFVVDFCSLEFRLVVEVDGSLHKQRRGPDAVRDQRLSELGFRVLRFANARVLNQLPSVIAEIGKAVREATPHPRPAGAAHSLSRGRGGRGER